MPLYTNTFYEMAANHLHYSEKGKWGNQAIHLTAIFGEILEGYKFLKHKFTYVKVEKGTEQAMVKELTFLTKRLSPERECQLETAN
jgi:hypothetical protein